MLFPRRGSRKSAKPISLLYRPKGGDGGEATVNESRDHDLSEQTRLQLRPHPPQAQIGFADFAALRRVLPPPGEDHEVLPDVVLDAGDIGAGGGKAIPQASPVAGIADRIEMQQPADHVALRWLVAAVPLLPRRGKELLQ